MSGQWFEPRNRARFIGGDNGFLDELIGWVGEIEYEGRPGFLQVRTSSRTITGPIGWFEPAGLDAPDGLPGAPEEPYARARWHRDCSWKLEAIVSGAARHRAAGRSPMFALRAARTYFDEFMARERREAER